MNARRFEIMYGVTQAWIDAKKAEQDYKCPLCLRATTRWAIDHDHACCPGIKTCGNCIRGLICQGCNNGLGMFGDDPEALRRAAAYLTRTINYSRISA